MQLMTSVDFVAALAKEGGVIRRLWAHFPLSLRSGRMTGLGLSRRSLRGVSTGKVRTLQRSEPKQSRRSRNRHSCAWPHNLETRSTKRAFRRGPRLWPDIRSPNCGQ